MIVNSAKKRFVDGDIDLLDDNIKVALLTSAHSLDLSHEYLVDVNNNEITASGYSEGGKSLSQRQTIVDSNNNRVEFTANPTVWSISGSVSARYAIVYKDTGDETDSPIIAEIDFGETRTANNGDFNINWDSDGILQFE